MTYSERYKEAMEALKKNDFDTAFTIFTEEKEKGCPHSPSELGVMYRMGMGVEEDLTKAKELFEEAMEKGNSIAAFNLGLLFHNGIGVEKDIKKAIKYYRKSSDDGYSRANYNLGVIYKEITPNHKNAVHYFTKAAENGDAEAKLNLGLYYYFGKGVECDTKKALELFLSGYKTASQDNYFSENKEQLLNEYQRIFYELLEMSSSAVKALTNDIVSEITTTVKENNGKMTEFTITPKH